MYLDCFVTHVPGLYLRTVSAVAGLVSTGWLLLFSVGLNVVDISVKPIKGPVITGLLVATALFVLWQTFGPLLHDARRAMRNGYAMVFVREVLLDEGRAMAEEHAVQDIVPTFLSRALTKDTLIAASPLLLGVGAITLAVAVLNHRFADTALPMFFLLAGLFLFGAGPYMPQASPLRAFDWGERFLVGRLGRLLFRVARIGLTKRAPDAAIAGERTEVALASAIDQLLGELPLDLRARFGDVREIISRLETDAAKFRARDARLSDVLARVDMHAPAAARSEQERSRTDLEAARADIRARFATTVVAIENIRLDLLRIQAGIGSLDDLTADLERAADLGRAVDAELAGRADVANLLSPPSSA